MADIRNSIRFLSRADLDTLGLGMGEIIDILEAAFRARAAGKVIMPPKIFFHRHGPRFYSSMVSASPDLGYAGCKWQSGDPDNAARGLPYIQGLYILTEDSTGQMRAIIDAEWITGHRTAAASGLVVRRLAKESDRTPRTRRSPQWREARWPDRALTRRSGQPPSVSVSRAR